MYTGPHPLRSKAKTLAEMLKDKQDRSPKPTPVERCFKAIEALPASERAFLQHVLMQCLTCPDLLTEDLPEKLLGLLAVVRGAGPTTLGLLKIALSDMPSVESFLSGEPPQPFL